MNHDQTFTIRNASTQEFTEVGQLMVRVYSQLEGFPTVNEQPAYYELLANVGNLTTLPGVELLVAAQQNHLAGAVVYFSDLKSYGSGGIATQEKNASGFRLLAVDPSFRGHGIGKLLTLECIRKAREQKSAQLIIHSTKAMQTAWSMYERMGFKRSAELDFLQGNLSVYGFRLLLN